MRPLPTNDFSVPPPDLLDAEARSLDWSDLIHRLREKSWLVLLCGLAGLCAVTFYVRDVPRVYRATAVLQIDPLAQGVLGFDAGTKDDFGTESAVATVLEGLHSRALLTRVAELNHLNEDRNFAPAAPDGGALSIESAAQRLGGMIDVQVRKGTQLVDVAVSHGNAQIAQTLANSLVNEFIQSRIEQRAASSQAVMTFLLKEAERLKGKLQRSDEAMQAYKEQHDALSLEERQDTVVAKLRSQASELNDAKAARIRLEAATSEIQAAAGKPDILLANPVVNAYPTVSALRQRIQALQTQILTLGLRYTEKHPKMIQTRAQLGEAKAALQDAALQVPQAITSEYERALATERSFEKALQDQERLALGLDKQGINYKVLTREMETDRALYDALLRRLKETDVAKGVELQNVRLFEAALLPDAPLPQHRSRQILFGAIGGIGLGMAIVLACFFLDNSWKTVDQAETATSLPVLAAIPLCGRMRPEAVGRLLLDQPASAVAEAFRFLRTSLFLKARKPGRAVFLLTSATPGEGKTFCAVNVAVSFAQQGWNTLLIDADLRSPDAGSALLGDPSAPGIGEYLLDKVSFPEVVHPTQTPNLAVIPAGCNTPQPGEMLSSLHFTRLVGEARANFELIVIDSAPILAVSDTLLLLEHADTVCLVARLGSVSPKSVLRARQVLAQHDRYPIGLILNGVPRRAAPQYYCAVDNYGERGYRPALTG